MVPCFQLWLLTILYKKLRGAKFLYHIQDLQIDVARDLNMIKSTQLISILLKVEKYILIKTDIISSISFGMIKKIKDKCNKDAVFFPNWLDTSMYFPIAEKSTLKQTINFSTIY